MFAASAPTPWSVFAGISLALHLGAASALWPQLIRLSSAPAEGSAIPVTLVTPERSESAPSAAAAQAIPETLPQAAVPAPAVVQPTPLPEATGPAPLPATPDSFVTTPPQPVPPQQALPPAVNGGEAAPPPAAPTDLPVVEVPGSGGEQGSAIAMGIVSFAPATGDGVRSDWPDQLPQLQTTEQVIAVPWFGCDRTQPLPPGPVTLVPIVATDGSISDVFPKTPETALARCLVQRSGLTLAPARTNGQPILSDVMELTVEFRP